MLVRAIRFTVSILAMLSRPTTGKRNLVWHSDSVALYTSSCRGSGKLSGKTTAASPEIKMARLARELRPLAYGSISRLAVL